MNKEEFLKQLKAQARKDAANLIAEENALSAGAPVGNATTNNISLAMAKESGEIIGSPPNDSGKQGGKAGVAGQAPSVSPESVPMSSVTTDDRPDSGIVLSGERHIRRRGKQGRQPGGEIPRKQKKAEAPAILPAVQDTGMSPISVVESSVPTTPESAEPMGTDVSLLAVRRNQNGQRYDTVTYNVPTGVSLPQGESDTSTKKLPDDDPRGIAVLKAFGIEGVPLPGSVVMSSSGEPPDIDSDGYSAFSRQEASASGVEGVAAVTAVESLTRTRDNRMESSLVKKETLSASGWVEEIVRLSDEVEKARAVYAEAYAIGESEKSLWKKVTSIFKDVSVGPNTSLLEAEQRYRSKLTELQNAELGRLKETNLSNEDLSRAMAETLRYFNLDEFQKLYEAQTQAKYIENEKSFVGRMTRRTHDFFVWYNKQPLKVKLGVAAGWATLAGATAGTGGALALPTLILIGRYGFGGMSASTALNALTEKFTQTKREKQLEAEHTKKQEVLDQTLSASQSERAFERYQAFLEKDIEEVTKKTEEWLTKDRQRRWLGRVAGFAAVPIVGKLLSIGMDTDTGRTLVAKLGAGWEEVKGFASQSSSYSGMKLGLADRYGVTQTPMKTMSEIIEGINVPREYYDAANVGSSSVSESAPGENPTSFMGRLESVTEMTKANMIEDVAKGGGVKPASVSSTETSIPSVNTEANVPQETAKNISEILGDEKARVINEYLQDHKVSKNDSLWKYSTELAQKLGIEKSDKFAALIEGIIREKIESDPELLRQAGFINDDLHVMAGSKINLSQVLSAQDVLKIVKEVGMSETVASQAVAEAANTPVSPQIKESVVLRGGTSSTASPLASSVSDDRITFFDGSNYKPETNVATTPLEQGALEKESIPSNVVENTQVASPDASSLNPTEKLGQVIAPPETQPARMMKVGVEVNSQEVLGPNVNESQLLDYLRSLSQAEQRVVNQKFNVLSKQLLELNINRVFIGDMPDTRLFNPNYNPRIWNAEVTTILDHRYFGTGTQNPLHSSQYARLKDLVDFAKSDRGFGAAGAPRPSTETLPGEKLRDYLIRLAALSHKTGIPLPRLN